MSLTYKGSGITPDKSASRNLRSVAAALGAVVAIPAHTLRAQGAPVVWARTGADPAPVRSYVPADIRRPLPVGYYGHLHNIYVQYAAERGIPELLCMLWFIGLTVWDCIRGIRRAPRPSQELFLLHGAIAVTIGELNDFGDRQPPHAFAGGRENSIRDCGSKRWYSGFAHAVGWIAGSRHKVNLDVRRIWHSQHSIVVKVVLLDRASIYGDLTAEDRGQAVVDAALDLRSNVVRIDRQSAINSAYHAFDPEFAIRADGDFRDMSNVRRAE